MLRRHYCSSMENEIEEEHRAIRRSLTFTDDISTIEEEKKSYYFNLNNNSLLNYLINIVNIFVRSPYSVETTVPHHQNSAIQKNFTDSIGYPLRWWTKHRARRRLQFNTKNLINTTINSTINTTTVTTVSTTVITPTVPPVTINSAINWNGMRWNICSGISIYTFYTLFFSLLLLRRPPFIIGFLI